MRRTALLAALVLALLSAGCTFKTGVNLTAQEAPVPDGWEYERTDYVGQGGARVATAIHVYAHGTSIDALAEELRDLMEADGWRIGGEGALRGGAGRYLEGEREDQFFACRVGRATSPSDEERGVPMECQFSPSYVSFDPNVSE